MEQFDPTSATWLYDDRNKSDFMLLAKRTLFTDSCHVLFECGYSHSECHQVLEPILVEVSSRRVLNEDWSCFYASNDKDWTLPEIDRLHRRGAEQFDGLASRVGFIAASAAALHDQTIHGEIWIAENRSRIIALEQGDIEFFAKSNPALRDVPVGAFSALESWIAAARMESFLSQKKAEAGAAKSF